MQKIPGSPKIGSDIECFLFDKIQKRIVPCVGVLPGTKEDPFPLVDLSEGYAVQEDNVMVEFNIPAATTYSGFANSIGIAIASVAKMVPEHHSLRFRSYANFKQSDLTSPQAQAFGCEPDFDAYAGGVQRAPLSAEGTLHRGAGGHIHLGGDFHCPDFVAALFADLMLGVNLDLRPHPKDKRAQFYGLPGIFRPKPYGVEYRTPSCLWAGESDKREWIGQTGLRLAQWLSNNEATVIQRTFRKFKDWPAVRAFMLNGENPPSREAIIEKAIKAGLPI